MTLPATRTDRVTTSAASPTWRSDAWIVHVNDEPPTAPVQEFPAAGAIVGGAAAKREPGRQDIRDRRGNRVIDGPALSIVNV